jgi:hypothetical protein
MSSGIVYTGSRDSLNITFRAGFTFKFIKEKIYYFDKYPKLNDPIIIANLMENCKFISVEDFGQDKNGNPVEMVDKLKMNIKTIMVKIIAGFGDFLYTHTVLQSHSHIKFILVCDLENFEMVTAKNITCITESEISNYITKVDVFVDFSQARREDDSNDLLTIFNNQLGLSDLPNKLNWKINPSTEDIEFVQVQTRGFSRRKKKVFLQYKGSTNLKQLSLPTMNKFIKGLIKEGWSVALHHEHKIPDDQFIDDKSFFNYTGKFHRRHLIPFIDICDAVITFDSSMVVLPICAKNPKKQYLFGIFGPTYASKRIGYHPNGYHFPASDYYEYKDGEKCWPCVETKERCGIISAKCMDSIKSSDLIKEFIKGHKTIIMDKKPLKARHWEPSI